ncbi:hypothetical protein GCM10011387_32870 [Pedobacter quisquiliarum]|uniref:Uncharacterized protein n=2 Tax=Pedobacter quisquiliarum TaxID=1834438 RepID=A0A916XJS5_9SPHI|nr:hypothetical protein GCM10011387_32870 [Pedobacter quisquiliarum]
MVVFAQGGLIDSAISKNYYTLKPVENSHHFIGEGWEVLLREIKKSNSVLIGETHFTKEVPYFANAVIDEVRFDNYFHEIDPYTNRIIANKINKLSPEKLKGFVSEYNSSFSFLEREDDFKLFEKIVGSGIQTFGVEQISLSADRLIVSGLAATTKNEKARKIYVQMIQNSAELAAIDKDNKYLFSEDFLSKISSLLKLQLSEKEKKQIEALKISREIYLTGNHHRRIQLMKNILLEEMPSWTNKKNLFKFGAFHTPKGESLMEIYDIGNLVFNIEDSNLRNALHIMIVGKNVTETIEDLKMYESFLKAVNNEDWYCFNLRPLQNLISKNRLTIENQTLLRIIKGNDFLIYVPRFTESQKT